MTRLALFVSALSLVACASEETPVADGSHVQVGGGKADGGGASLYVSTAECQTDLCTEEASASCGLVTLHQGSRQIARGITSDGQVSFEGLEPGDYTVKFHKRDNSIAKMVVDEYTGEQASASVKVTVDDSADVRFLLAEGTQALATRCADVRGDVRVKAASGGYVDRADVEWSWVEELVVNGEVVDRMRPLFIDATNHQPATNVLAWRELQAGAYTVRFVPVDVPEDKQRPNPNYAELVEDYSAGEPINVTMKITSSQATGKTVTFDKTITDARR